jgi:hypothetical protein
MASASLSNENPLEKKLDLMIYMLEAQFRCHDERIRGCLSIAALTINVSATNH